MGGGPIFFVSQESICSVQLRDYIVCWIQINGGISLGRIRHDDSILVSSAHFIWFQVNFRKSQDQITKPAHHPAPGCHDQCQACGHRLVGSQHSALPDYSHSVQNKSIVILGFILVFNYSKQIRVLNTLDPVD